MHVRLYSPEPLLLPPCRKPGWVEDWPCVAQWGCFDAEQPEPGLSNLVAAAAACSLPFAVFLWSPWAWLGFVVAAVAVGPRSWFYSWAAEAAVCLCAAALDQRVAALASAVQVLELAKTK